MGSENIQLELLKQRIEYDEKIFGEAKEYYEFADSEENSIYTLKENPQVGDMTYIYDNELMIQYKPIESVSEVSNTINEITYTSVESFVIEDITYTPTNLVVSVLETYIKVLNRLLEDSKFVALSIRFPYQDYSNMDLPSKYKNWQLRCCQEIYQGIGTEGIKSYAENGLSWTRDSGYISYELRSEIESFVGDIHEEVEEETTEEENEGD